MFKYSVNDIATIVLTPHDTIKISMMSMKTPKPKLKFTTMHEGFKESDSSEDTEIVSYTLDLKHLDIGAKLLDKQTFNLTLVPQRRNAS